MYYIYILKSLKDYRTYTGYTSNLGSRLRQHSSGQVKSTKHRRPLSLIYSEEFKEMQDAKKRELWWKSSVGRTRLKELVFGVRAV